MVEFRPLLVAMVFSAPCKLNRKTKRDNAVHYPFSLSRKAKYDLGVLYRYRKISDQ